MDYQTQSRLLTAPSEIRCAIFDLLVPKYFHLVRREGTVKLLPCVQDEKDRDTDTSNRRTNEEDLFMDPRATDLPYLHRLRSSWATHWRCEEVVLGLPESRVATPGTRTLALMTTCKEMSVPQWKHERAWLLTDFLHRLSDVLQTLGHHTVIHVNELHVLEALNSGLGFPTLDAGQQFRASALAHIVPNLKELCVDLRLPLDTYSRLENYRRSKSCDTRAIAPWIELHTTVGCFPKLQRLRIWLDHDEPESWTIVNERAALFPLQFVGKTSEIDIQVDLPKLHPKYESPERHFTQGSEPKPAFTIIRRFRQREHAVQESDGFLWPTRAPDFPLLYGMVGDEAWGNCTLEEVEQRERRIWKEGRHPYDEFKDVEDEDNEDGDEDDDDSEEDDDDEDDDEDSDVDPCQNLS